jgi:membrane associated rhomboid family serine protease
VIPLSAAPKRAKGGKPRRRGPFPTATTALVLATAAAYVRLLLLAPATAATVVAHWALVPARLAPLLGGDLAALPAALRLASSLLLHAGLLHLLGNLLFLWVFGRAVEAAMGSARFLGFYLLCGVLAGLVHTLVQPASTLPTIGSSGAISGVMGAYLGLHPRARVRSLVLLLVWPLVTETPALVWLLGWVAMQLLQGARALAGPGGGAVGTAWWAHVGGFAGGLLLHRFFLGGRRGTSRPA